MAYLRCNIVKQEIPHINAYVAHHVHVLNRVLQQSCSQQKTFKAKAGEVKTTPIPVEMDLYYGVLAVQQCKGKTFSILCRTPCGDRRHIVKPMRVQHPDRTQIILIALKSSKDHSQNSKIGTYKIFMQGPCARSSRSSYTTSPGSPQDLLLRTYATLCTWMPAQQDLLKMLRSTKYCACHKT